MWRRRRRPMKILVGVVAVVLLVAGSAYVVNAKERHKPHQSYAKTYYGYAHPRVNHEPSYPNAYGWYPHDADRLPIGSAIWWEQMRREGRLGGETK
jgi:hypothetical protein